MAARTLLLTSLCVAARLIAGAAACLALLTLYFQEEPEVGEFFLNSIAAVWSVAAGAATSTTGPF